MKDSISKQNFTNLKAYQLFHSFRSGLKPNTLTKQCFGKIGKKLDPFLKNMMVFRKTNIFATKWNMKPCASVNYNVGFQLE